MIGYYNTVEDVKRDIYKEMLSGTYPVDYADMNDSILDDNYIDMYFPSVSEANAFIAGNPELARQTLDDPEMYSRYNASLNPFERPCSFADAMIERSILDDIKDTMGEDGEWMDKIDKASFLEGTPKGIQRIECFDLPEDLISDAEGILKGAVAQGTPVGMLKDVSYDLGLYALHANEKESALFVLSNTDYFDEAYREYDNEGKNVFEDIQVFEADVIANIAIGNIIDELTQAGIDPDDVSKAADYFSNREQSKAVLQDQIKEAEESSNGPGNKEAGKVIQFRSTASRDEGR